MLRADRQMTHLRNFALTRNFKLEAASRAIIVHSFVGRWVSIIPSPFVNNVEAQYQSLLKFE